MYLEQEVYGMIRWGFVITLVLTLVTLTIFYLKFKVHALVWFGSQAAFFSLAFYYFYRAITWLPNQADAMYSENQSLNLALAGLCWAAGMGFMLVGIGKLLRVRFDKPGK